MLQIHTISAYLFRTSGRVTFQVLRPLQQTTPTMCQFTVIDSWDSPDISTLTNVQGFYMVCIVQVWQL